MGAGHYHLSHNYPDSASLVNRCTFFNTGVIGNGNRDGCRHSRLVEGGAMHLPQLILPSCDAILRHLHGQLCRNADLTWLPHLAVLTALDCQRWLMWQGILQLTAKASVWPPWTMRMEAYAQM